MKIHHIIEKTEPGKTIGVGDKSELAGQKYHSMWTQAMNRGDYDLADRIREKFKRLKRTKDTLVGDEFFAMLDKNCSEIMNIYRQQEERLYRGNSSDSDVIYGKPHTKRRPLGNKLAAVHDKFNEYLDNNGNVRRDQATFASSRKSSAEFYSMHGTSYLIFPVDGFKYTWNETEDDLDLSHSYVLLVDWPNYLNDLRQHLEKNSDIIHSDKYRETEESLLAWNRTKTPDSSQKMKSLYDTLQISATAKGMMNAPGLLKYIDPGNFSIWSFVNTDLVDAMEAQHEVWFTGPYYGIKTSPTNMARFEGYINNEDN